MDDNGYAQYSRYLSRSVSHIFKNFLEDAAIEEVYETQSGEKDPCVAVEIQGAIRGEIVINLPKKTLDLITKKFVRKSDTRTIRRSHSDVAGELANLISGTLANQLQYADLEVRLLPPEYNDDPITIKALYDNINLSFQSSYGGFDIDFYYKNME